jgi:hypothetical protein
MTNTPTMSLAEALAVDKYFTWNEAITDEHKTAKFDAFLVIQGNACLIIKRFEQAEKDG